jgi:hypothetical protein
MSIVALWVETPYGFIAHFKRFGGTYRFHLQGKYAIRSSETLATTYRATSVTAQKITMIRLDIVCSSLRTASVRSGTKERLCK